MLPELWLSKWLSTPFLNRPMRGPTTTAPTSATAPPTMCTTADPAKSRRPLERAMVGACAPVAQSTLRADSHPASLHTQCTTTG
jgi:hypothetical protein